MDTGKKYVETTTRHRTRISETEDESARCCCKKHPSKRPRREDLLGYFLRMHDAKRSCSVNKEEGVFTLPCPDSLRRDIEELRRFIRMREPHGVLLREEVVIVTEETKVAEKEVPKEQTPRLSQQADAQC